MTLLMQSPAPQQLSGDRRDPLIRFRPVSSLDPLRDELIDIIENDRLTTVFQPIIDLMTGKVYAYEALCRIAGDNGFENIEALFQTARKHNLTASLEKCSRERVLEAIRKMNPGCPVAINVCPSVLMMADPRINIPYLYEELFGMRDRVIIELTERFYIQDYDSLVETVEFFRRKGFKIALDDLGAGFTRLKLLSQIQPNIIKIDRFLISDIHKSTKKQLLVDAIVSFCRKMGSLVVAEGIESAEELDTLMDMKIDLAQGFYLCRPSETIQVCTQSVRSWIEKKVNKMPAPLKTGLHSNEIGGLMNQARPIDVSSILTSVMENFSGEEKISALPVVEGNRPVGIIQKNTMYYKLGQPHGYALFSNKPVQKIMESALVFESNTPLEEVARTVLKRSQKEVYDAVIVVKNGAYAGIVEIHQLLHGITEQKIQLAMQANPLTGLPGNNLIEAEIVRRLNQNRIFAVLYIDLDTFKPFNDNFGFVKGDQAIRFLAGLLKDAVARWDETGGFVGHVGGDDFVAICRAGGVECLCGSIISGFDRGIRELHDPATLKQGYYISQNRSGQTERFPLLSVSIAVVTSENRRFESYGHLVSVASEVKKKVKTLPGSRYYIDTRQE
ncbi:MAG: EAL and GGDEF domain-containing protein [Desulfobacteraceae bacterium]|nr:EAL and GGDEF domain-containing protein [Desulfobacteraceae bacterium]